MRFKDAVWATSDPPRRSAAARHSAGASMSAGGHERRIGGVGGMSGVPPMLTVIIDPRWAAPGPFETPGRVVVAAGNSTRRSMPALPIPKEGANCRFEQRALADDARRLRKSPLAALPA
jgi:hypothetical protein